MKYLILLITSIMITSCITNQLGTVSNDNDMDLDNLHGLVIKPGLYAVGDETTEYARTRLYADGTYIDLNGDEPVANGTWFVDGARMCFDPEGDAENQKERCWINSPINDDGSFISTREDGSQSYKVTQLE